MTKHVWSYTAAVPSANRRQFTEQARKAAKIYKFYGALEVWENWSEETPDMRVMTYPSAVQLREDESVVMGWVVWPDRETADRCMAEMQDDPKWPELGHMPFDGKRILFGQFSNIVRM